MVFLLFEIYAFSFILKLYLFYLKQIVVLAINAGLLGFGNNFHN